MLTLAPAINTGNYVGSDYIHRGTYYADAANIVASGVAELVNARIGIRKDNFTVELFARSLSDDQSPGITDNSLAPTPAPVVLPGG